MIQIQFIKGINETTIPEIRLTRSSSGETGTATFHFHKPNLFKIHWYENYEVTGMYILYKNRIIKTQYIKIYFKHGKPETLEAIYILRNINEWDTLIQLLNQFSDQNNLTFIKAKT